MRMIFFALISLVFLALSIIHFCTRYGKLGRLVDIIPGPKPLPILGNLLSFNLPPKKLWITMQEMQVKNPIFRIWSGVVPMVFTRDVHHMKTFLSSRTNINKKVQSHINLKSFGNDGLIVSDREVWESRRKMLNQAFTQNMLQFYSKKIDVWSKIVISKLSSYDDSTVHEVSPIFEKFALAVGCDTVLDYRLEGEKEQEGKGLQDAMNSVNEGCTYRIFHPYITDWMLKFLPIGRRQQTGWKYGEEFVGRVIEERKQFYASSNLLQNHMNNIDKLDDDEIKQTKKNLSVLDIMLLHAHQDSMSKKDMKSEAIFMLGAAFKTTATALTFLLISLAENKEVQDLCRGELLGVIGGDDKDITMEHIKQLDYIERCVKESMRLHTIIPYIARSVDEEIKLGEYTIPVGTEMYFNVFQLHRDPELWPEPLKFDPDRFLPENVKNRHPFAYAPFSKGPRNCLGQKMAMIEIKSLVAHILYSYYLEPIDFSAGYQLYNGLLLVQDKTRVKFVKIH